MLVGSRNLARRRSACGRLTTLACAGAFALAGAGAARADCGNVGSFAAVLFPTQTSNADGFAPGDQLIITASYSSGPDSTTVYAELRAGSTVLVDLGGPIPTVSSFTVPAHYGPSTLFTIENTNNVNAIEISVTCVPAPAMSEPTYQSAVTKAFLLARINGLLLNSPAAMSLINRGDGASASGVVIGGGGVGSGDAFALRTGRFDTAEEDAFDARSIRFSQSLAQIRGQLDAAQANSAGNGLGAGDGTTLPLGPEAPPPGDIWVEGRFSGYTDDAGNLDREGYVGLLSVGGDYRVFDDMIVGVMAQFDWSKDESDTLATQVDGHGWMFGPYMSMQVFQNIYVDLRGAWGRSSNDLVMTTAFGSFDTTRWLVKGTIAGKFAYDAWRIRPTVEVSYMRESQESFTDSSGAFVAAQDVSLGRVQFGPEVGYRFAPGSDITIEPFVALKGVWNWENPQVGVVGGVTVEPAALWGRLEGGLNMTMANGVLMRTIASWDGLGDDDYSGYTLKGIVSIPLQ